MYEYKDVAGIEEREGRKPGNFALKLTLKHNIIF
jgi:hypothetical protein